MKTLEKLKLHNLEEICAEDQKSLKGGDGSGYFGGYTGYTGGDNPGSYNGSAYVSPSTNSGGGFTGSYTPNIYVPGPTPVTPSSPSTGSYPSSSQGGTFTGSGSY